jgi:autotransporter-associated beta strand protein
MKHRTSCRIVVAGLWAAALLSTPLVARAAIVGPYFDLTDTNTLHLWHLDESAAPAADMVVGGGMNLAGLLNSATLGNAGYSGFGTALSTASSGSGKNATLAVSATGGNVTITVADTNTGAFTFEALVRIGFDPTTNSTIANQILSGESGSNPNRIFQFRIVPKGFTLYTGGPVAGQPYLTFENIRALSANQPTLYAPIPTTGPDAIAFGQWYHVAVTYNGVPSTANNLNFYWTLLDPSRTAVSAPLTITSPTTTLTGLNPLATITTPFMVGNWGRSLNNNFLGLIDEVRISRIARNTSDMMFNTFAPTNPPMVMVPPADATAVAGDPVILNVLASGVSPLAYQWRLDGTNLPGATASKYALAAVQAASAGTYDVVVTNNYGAVTSATANVSLRTPRNLTWVGSAGATWDTTSVNWGLNGNTVAETAYTERDSVIFDSTGSAAPVVTLGASRSPYSMTVNANSDYTLTTSSGATLSGLAQFLTKSGSGTLVLDVDWPGVGASTIGSGTVQLGNASARGTLGYGPVTNNGTLLINRSSGALSFTNWLVGTGSLTNNGATSITVSGTNLLSGPITLNGGTLTLTKAQARGNTTQYTLNAGANWPGLTVGGGITFGPATTLSFLGTSLTPDNRAGLNNSDSTNTFNCAIVLDGSGSVIFSSNGQASNSLMVVTTPSINYPAYTGQFLLRGVGNGVLTSQLSLGGKLSKTDAGTWTINSTGNSWVATDVAAGILRMGAHNALPNLLTLNLTATTVGATLDLAGFNQSIDTLTGPGNIANSSTVADSTLTVHPSSISIFAGAIKDSVSGGTRKVGLTVSSGTLTLQGTNTYTGPTMVAAGASLQFLMNGCSSNTTSFTLGTGASLDASTRLDGSFILNPGQTLKGDSQFNVTGNLLSAGTIKMKLSKSGSTLANDSLNVSGGFTCGGTLLVDLSASPALAPGDAFPLFSAGGGFSGAFIEVIPGPGFGLAWDTSTLATDGTLRVVASSVPSTGTSILSAVTGNQLSLSWPANYIGWRLQAQTNSSNSGLSTNWVNVPGSSVTNQVFLPINKTAGSVFYRMVYP